MFRSLFLFDVTFWLYLAAVCLYFGYILASRPALVTAAAGHPTAESGDAGWAEPLGQLATWVTLFGLVVNGLALGTRAYERMQLSGTFAPLSKQFEAISYVSFAMIAGYLVMVLKYKIKFICVLVVCIAIIATVAVDLLASRYQTA